MSTGYATEPDDYIRPVLFLLRLMAGSVPPPDPKVEVVRHERWDRWARGEDAKIVRCEKQCGGWAYQYPVCRSCRTKHVRPFGRNIEVNRGARVSRPNRKEGRT